MEYKKNQLHSKLALLARQQDSNDIKLGSDVEMIA